MKKSMFLYLLISISISSYSQYDSTGIQLKTFLQGATTGSSMQTLLNQDTLLPFQHPYNTAPWNYSGSENLITIPLNMVDWVLVEIRSRIDTIVSRRAALLLFDGSIVDTNGDAGIKFSNYTNSFYIVVYHRNHLPVMTSNPVNYSTLMFYDFTDTLNYPIYGNDFIDNGGFATMIAGDVNVNKQLKYSGTENDRAPIIQKIVNESGSSSITNTIDGYYTNEDVNMNGILKYSGPENDPSKIIQNLVTLTGTNAITSVYNSHIPDGYLLQLECGDTLSDPRNNEKYPIVKIGTQCWMVKNLNIGIFVTSISTGINHSEQSNNGIIEKYCNGNIISNCSIYGGMYDWDEMMEYDTIEKSQGICPDGWYIPSDNEWKILEGYTDNIYGLNSPEWDNTGIRGFDAGGNLKQQGILLWKVPNAGATNNSGFTSIPGGFRDNWGNFDSPGKYSLYWTSTHFNITHAWDRNMHYTFQGIVRHNVSQESGLSVRCIKDVSCLLIPTKSDAGPNQSNIKTENVFLQANTPVYGLGIWNISTGVGGIMQDPYDPLSMFKGKQGKTYELIWSISTNCAISNDTVYFSFADSSWSCGDTLLDSRDGQLYPTVLIGNQCWMAANICIGSKVDVSVEQLNNGNIEKYCHSDNDSLCEEYGGLYQWGEAMQYSTSTGAQGICTNGWHVPSNSEWNTLISYVGGLSVAGGKLKETGTLHWKTPNSSATNSYGFTSLPAGWRFNNTSYAALTLAAPYWTSSKATSNTAERKWIKYDSASMVNYTSYFDDGFSVRCLKD